MPRLHCLVAEKWFGGGIERDGLGGYEPHGKLVSNLSMFCHPCLSFLVVKDERVEMLGCSLRGAKKNGFANGQAKALLYELVRLVRVYGVCKTHRMQLNV